MKGFTKILVLILLLCALSALFYIGYTEYQKYKVAKGQVTSLEEIDSNYRELRSYIPNNSSQTPPIITSDSSSYTSPFSPCVRLINDRNWEIYSSSRNIFPGNEQLMLYDRFWSVVWLGLKPKGSEIVNFRFYGPFQLEDVSERSFVEYLLIGRDVTQDGGTFEIPLLTDCNK